MPLPAPNTQWPPPNLAATINDQQGWAAWWSGKPDRLAAYYGGTTQSTQENGWERSWSRRNGLVGAVQRWFWGQQTPNGEQRAKLHVPVAQEIATVSADLLYASPPTIKVADKPTQEVIDRLLGESAHTLFHEAAESGSALGHQWFRVGVDRAVDPDGPIVSLVDADAAFPEYRYGRLSGVLFLSEWPDEAGSFWRHLEYHTVLRDSAGRNPRGLVQHGLYYGDARNIGRRVDLDQRESTAHLAGLIREIPGSGGLAGIATGLDRIDVVGIANARSIDHRGNPDTKDWGRADISGVEPLLDAVDDAWTSWMRDLRHGRSRIHVPQNYLRSQGVGKGAIADIDRELYVGLQAMPQSEGMELTATQFAIRWQEHETTINAALKALYGGAGYSPQTFGLGEVAALTAAESFNRQVRTGWTRNAKVRRQRQGLIQLTRVVLAMDALQFGGRGRPQLPVQVMFQESVAESQQSRAQTSQLLSAARAASIDTLVRLNHPDWDDQQVQVEVDRIEDEDATDTPDPATFGAGGAGLGVPPGRPAGTQSEDDPDEEVDE